VTVVTPPAEPSHGVGVTAAENQDGAVLAQVVTAVTGYTQKDETSSVLKGLV
jgi:hypothetical protein